MSTRSDTRDRWRRILQQQRASGLPVLAFCRRAGVPESSFYAWRRKLGDEATFAEVKVSPATASQAGGLGTPGTAAKTGDIELRLPGRRCVVVRPGFDRPTLVELLQILEQNASDWAAREAGA